MPRELKPLTEFLVGLGIDRIGHTNKTYLAHLAHLYRLLEERGGGEDVCRAGMFHSIYGTELFQGFTLPLERRGEIRALIGERAERLAYLNCAMHRPAFDRDLEQQANPRRVVDRFTGREVELSTEDFDDLCRIHLYDWLEQVARAGKWDYRRPAYRRMAERLGGVATEFYDQVFAQKPAGAASLNRPV
jgi:hypothetical protein